MMRRGIGMRVREEGEIRAGREKKGGKKKNKENKKNPFWGEKAQAGCCCPDNCASTSPVRMS